MKSAAEVQDLPVHSSSPYFKSAAERQTSVLLLRNKASQQHHLITSLATRCTERFSACWWRLPKYPALHAPVGPHVQLELYGNQHENACRDDTQLLSINPQGGGLQYADGNHGNFEDEVANFGMYGTTLQKTYPLPPVTHALLCRLLLLKEQVAWIKTRCAVSFPCKPAAHTSHWQSESALYCTDC